MGKNSIDKIKRISILIPAKDEEETIGILLSDINKQIKRMQKYKWEVIVVADHCVDKTGELAKNAGALVITNQRPSGKGNALISGFAFAQGDIIIMMDADYSHRPEDISKFLPPLLDQTRNIGLVIGSRSLGGSDEYTFIRTLGNIFLTFFVNLLFHLQLTDSINGYKAFRKSIVKDHTIYSSQSFEIEIELIYNTLLQHSKVVEIASHERARAGGEMKSRVCLHGQKFLSCILKKGIQYNLRLLFNK